MQILNKEGRDLIYKDILLYLGDIYKDPKDINLKRFALHASMNYNTLRDFVYKGDDSRDLTKITKIIETLNKPVKKDSGIYIPNKISVTRYLRKVK